MKKENQAWVGVTGGVYSLESTYVKKSRSWHPHLHVLIEMPSNHPDEWLAELKAAWLHVTGNAKVLRLEPVYSRTRRGKKIHRRVDLKSLKELVKYVTKAASFADEPERVGEFFEAFQHVRRMQSFGSFLGVVEESEHEPGDEHGMLKCSCGDEHRHAEFLWSSVPVHINDTVLMADGSRQLKFDFARLMADSEDESPPPLVLEVQEVSPAYQQEIGFAGPLPALSASLPQLFAAGD